MTNINLKPRADMTRTSLYLPPKLLASVKDIAKQNDISVNSTIVQLLELSLDVGEAYQQGICSVTDLGDVDALDIEQDRNEPIVANL